MPGCHCTGADLETPDSTTAPDSPQNEGLRLRRRSIYYQMKMWAVVRKSSPLAVDVKIPPSDGDDSTAELPRTFCLVGSGDYHPVHGAGWMLAATGCAQIAPSLVDAVIARGYNLLVAPVKGCVRLSRVTSWIRVAVNGRPLREHARRERSQA